MRNAAMNFTVKIKILIFLFLFSLSAASLFAQQAPLHEGEKIDGVVAVVGKYPILKSTIDLQVLAALTQTGKVNASPDTVARIREQILQNEIDQKALLVRAEQDSTITAPTET